MGGYKLEKLQILNGGFTLLTPGDKTPKEGLLLAQNFRVDRQGRLVSRWGYPQKFSITGPSYAHTAAVAGGVEGNYYVAANSLLGANPCAVYFNFNSTAIVTGLSGNRCGMVQMNGWMWIMDSLVQGRHNAGSGYKPWSVDPPVSACAAAAGAANADGPNGTYNFYVTFQSADEMFETNPYPEPVTLTVTNQNIDFTGVPVSADVQVGFRNIYASGGTLGSGGSGNAYLVAAIPNNTATTASWISNDLTVTDAGITMPTTNDPPPAASGMAGPYFSRLYAWSGSRLYYTDPGIPQYWPGSANPATGNWTNVGSDGEDIQWCTVHNNVLMIYKERSIWQLVGDPDTGTLGMVEDGVGLVNPFAIASGAGPVDYFVAPNGLRRCNLDRTEEFGAEISPLFNSPIVNGGSAIETPGSVLPGANYLTDALDSYAVALGYGMGKLYVAYGENVSVGTGAVLLVYEEQSKRWMYHRNALGTDRFYGFLFDGVTMCGLTGANVNSGGPLTQVSLSMPGTIALTASAAPLVSLAGDAQAAGLVAMLKAAPIGGPVTVEVLAGATVLGTVTIAEGSTSATAAATMATAPANTPVTLAITAVPVTYPGGDLTVELWCYQAGTGGGSGGSDQALGYNVDDFRSFYPQDDPKTAIECVYQSHYEDAGLPDNQKNWLEAVVDYVLQPNGDTATVYVGYDNGTPASVGTLTGGTGVRQQQSFSLGYLQGTDGVLAKNCSVAIDCAANGTVEIHNVYLYYYVEARLSLAASTIPVDLGSGKVKQCKELALDIDSSGGAVSVNLYSDLPGNALFIRQNPIVAAASGGRAVWKYPFPVTEGYLWRLALTAEAGPFRLYGARLLMRVVGTYIEAYEAANGFVWDSMEMTFASAITHIPRQYAIALAAIPIKQFREISLEIETFTCDVTVAFLTDLPANAQAVRKTWTVNTGTAGRRFVRLPLPAGTNAPVEGRLCRIQISGASKFILYDAAVEFLPVGEYIEAYEAAAGAVYDSREEDFKSAKPKEARELELDIETTGAVTATVYSDLPGLTMAQVFQSGALPTNTVTTTGRQKIRLPLASQIAGWWSTWQSPPLDYPMGRMFRLLITGSNAFRLYGAKLKIREFGAYLTNDENLAGGAWDSTPLDFASERVKEYKKLEFDMQTDTTNAVTLTLWTDQPNGAMTQQFSTTITTGGARRTVKIPLTQGIRGRRLQVQMTGTGVRLFAGRVWLRPLNEPKAQWTWAPLPIEPTKETFEWASFPVNPTPPGQDAAQWIWGRVLEVAETPSTFEWIDVPFEVGG